MRFTFISTLKGLNNYLRREVLLFPFREYVSRLIHDPRALPWALLSFPLRELKKFYSYTIFVDSN